MDTDPHPISSETDEDVERLSRELKAQMQLAKARIVSRYAKLIEQRSLEPFGHEA